MMHYLLALQSRFCNEKGWENLDNFELVYTSASVYALVNTVHIILAFHNVANHSNTFVLSNCNEDIGCVSKLQSFHFFYFFFLLRKREDSRFAANVKSRNELAASCIYLDQYTNQAWGHNQIHIFYYLKQFLILSLFKWQCWRGSPRNTNNQLTSGYFQLWQAYIRKKKFRNSKNLIS